MLGCLFHKLINWAFQIKDRKFVDANVFVYKHGTGNLSCPYCGLTTNIKQLQRHFSDSSSCPEMARVKLLPSVASTASCPCCCTSVAADLQPTSALDKLVDSGGISEHIRSQHHMCLGCLRPWKGAATCRICGQRAQRPDRAGALPLVMQYDAQSLRRLSWAQETELAAQDLAVRTVTSLKRIAAQGLFTLSSANSKDESTVFMCQCCPNRKGVCGAMLCVSAELNGVL